MSNFSFNSLFQNDKLVYKYHNSRSFTKFTSSTSSQPITIEHGCSTQFVPSIRYSIDNGETWYYDGSTNYTWYSGSQQYLPDFYMTVKCNDNDIVIDFHCGQSDQNVIYDIFGVSKNV